MKPAVSIILPVYNVEQYLEECLESILNQTYDDYELIAINDGSTDKSLIILGSYHEKFAGKLTIYSQTNLGVAVARNKGLSVAKGKYVYFLDSDDWIDEKTLEVCVDSLEKENANLVLFDAKAFSDGVSGSILKKFNYVRNLPKTIYYGNQVFSDSVNNLYIVPCWCYLFEREYYKDLGFIPGILHEDNFFTTMLFIKSRKAVVLKEQFFNRRVRPNSIMTMNKTKRHFDGYYCTIKELKNNLSKEGEKGIKKELAKYYNTLLRYAIFSEIEVNGKLNFKRKFELLKDNFDFINANNLLFLFCYKFHNFLKAVIRNPQE